MGGVDVKDYDLDTLRNAVAMVLQKNVLFSGTIKENLRWGNEQATDAELQEACRLANADEFIATFPKGYDTYLEQGGANVSGGQKQRVLLARALCATEKMIFLDEPITGLDPVAMKEMYELIERLNKEMGITIIMVTHDIENAMKYSDKILCLKKNENFFGTPEEYAEYEKERKE